MTLTFSQRMGLKPVSRPLQIDDMDANLRNGLWNAMTIGYWEQYESGYQDSDLLIGSNFWNFARGFAYDHDMIVDSLPRHWDEMLEVLRTYYFDCSWDEAYGFVEYLATNGPEERLGSTVRNRVFIQLCDDILERSNSAFRFIDGKVAPISNETEIQEIERALVEADQYAGVKGHLQSALALLTGTNPDYRNSIKESISAVESLCKHLTNDPTATLGTALKNVDNKHKLQPTIKQAFEKLYGYTNGPSGIRHSAMEDAPSVSPADARYMLISCSAFINFVIDSTKD